VVAQTCRILLDISPLPRDSGIDQAIVGFGVVRKIRRDGQVLIR